MSLRFLKLGAVALTALVLAGSTGFAAETLIMGTTGRGSAQQWPIFIADQKGYFAENNVKMDLVSAPSSAAVIQQLTAGSINLGSGGLADPLRAIDKGAPITLLRVETQVPPYSVWGKKDLKSIKDLKGKLISIGGIKDITRIYLERMLGPNGVAPGQYDLVFAGTTAARFAALAAGAVDAAILVPPFTFKAEGEGYSNLGALSDYEKKLPFTGYAVNTTWAKAHKPALVGFLKGVAKGIDWFNDPANRTQAIDILVKESGSTRSDIEMTYDYYTKIKIFDRIGLVGSSEVKTLAEAMKSIGDLEGSTDVARFADPEIVELAKQVK
ncbi:MAG: alkanesulfonate transporter substrate-binding subunit [Hyphomicrobiales bacterium]|nr:alkanesulfonate transporter substrate-binding subunit [Hyphomicrobiales bacterium]